MVGVVGSNPIAPTKFGRQIKGLAVSPSPLSLAPLKRRTPLLLPASDRGPRIAVRALSRRIACSVSVTAPASEALNGRDIDAVTPPLVIELPRR